MCIVPDRLAPDTPMLGRLGTRRSRACPIVLRAELPSLALLPELAYF